MVTIGTEHSLSMGLKSIAAGGKVGTLINLGIKVLVVVKQWHRQQTRTFCVLIVQSLGRTR